MLLGTMEMLEDGNWQVHMYASTHFHTARIKLTNSKAEQKLTEKGIQR